MSKHKPDVKDENWEALLLQTSDENHFIVKALRRPRQKWLYGDEVHCPEHVKSLIEMEINWNLSFDYAIQPTRYKMLKIIRLVCQLGGDLVYQWEGE